MTESNTHLRAAHTCMREASSLDCAACAGGVPYPAPTVDEIIEAMRATRASKP